MSCFSRVTDDYYTRRYEIAPEITGDQKATIYAECSKNVDGVNGHYYWLDLYLSANDIATRDYVIGVSFGQGKMDKHLLDEEIDRWVAQIANKDTFPEYLQDYIRKEQMWEDAN